MGSAENACGGNAGAATSTVGIRSPPIVRNQPSVDHCHRLNRRLPTQRAAPTIAKRPAAQIDHVGLSVRRLHQVGVSRALQLGIRPIARGQDVGIWMQFVGPEEAARARHRHGMAPPCAAFGGDEVVVAVPLVEVRRLGEPDGRPLEDQLTLADELRLALEYSCRTIPANRFCPGRWSHSMLTRYFRPSSS